MKWCRIVRTDKRTWQNQAIEWEKLETPFVVLAGMEDVFPEEELQYACEYAQKEQLDAVMLKCRYVSEKGKTEVSGAETQKQLSGRMIHLNQRKEIVGMPDDYEAVVYRKERLAELMERTKCAGRDWKAAELFFQMAEEKKTIGYIDGSNVQISHPAPGDISGNPDNRKPEWYLDELKEDCKKLLSDAPQPLPAYIQLHLLRELILRFDTNKNHHNKQALDVIQLQQFREFVGELLQKIEDEWLISGTRIWNGYGLSFALQETFLHLKYKNLQEVYSLTDPEKEQNGKTYPVRIAVNGRRLENQILPRVCLDVVNYEQNTLILDCSCPYFMDGKQLRWTVLWNEEELHCQETQRYNDTSYFGVTEYRGYTFRLKIPKSAFRAQNTLKFVLIVDGKKIPHPIITRRFTSRISSALDQAYWYFDQYMMMFNMGRVKKTIRIRSCTSLQHIKQEQAFLKELKNGRTAKPEMIKERLWYWASYPFYHKKNIWLTFDKLYKGGDCGEYFYKYALTRKDTDVVPVYVMNEDAEDTKRLRKEGYRPVIHGSRRHRLLYLHAKMVFATHAGLYNFNGIKEEEIPYLQDLIAADAVCIQHGLTVQDLAFNANQAFNNNKLYYCASKYEIQNLSQPQYGYLDKEALRLTGLARFDGLKNRDQKQILITPTWRNYIALWPNGKNESRPYSELFKQTEYYRIYNDLITDPKLLDTAKKTGYRLIYLVHPNIGEQAVDFEQKEGVELISALDVNYENILCESSLMLTDYSGVQFDFAYMRKPVVYYHPPKLPPHYVEGGFFYDTQGFGEICTKHQELVDVLCDYMEQGCELKAFYKKRQDDFFAFSDQDNCRRIFEDARKWQKENR